MKLEEKKQLILECVRLGMDTYESTLLAECDEEEIEILNTDKMFQKRIEYSKHCKERDLLELHDEAVSIALGKGETKGIQWRLEKLRPEKYAKTINNNIKAAVKTEKEYSFENMSKEEKERVAGELLEVLKKDIEQN